jgi:GTP:adenosylcobinamide-phosphate guanylyltransferase
MLKYSVIITASFIISHPSIDFIKCVIESLKYIHMDKDTPIILAHDYSEDSRFREYLKNLKNYIINYKNIKIVVRNSHGHLTGNLRNAFNEIKTEYVLIIQHDLPFIRDFEINKVIEDMNHNPKLKHVRFNKRANIKAASDALNNLFGKQIVSKNYTYTRTPSWSDNNHLCLSDYYRDIILKECDDGKAMEQYLIKKSKNNDIHNKYGTYIFDEINKPAYIKHLDGRRNPILEVNKK